MLTLPTNQSKPCATKAGSCGSLLPKIFSAKPWSLLTPLRGNSSLPLLRPLTILLFLLELTFWNFHFPPCALMFFQHQSVHGTKTLGRKKPWELWIIQLWLTQDIPNNQGSYCWCPPGVSPCVFPRAGAGTVAVSEAVQQVTHLSLSLSLFPQQFSRTTAVQPVPSPAPESTAVTPTCWCPRCWWQGWSSGWCSSCPVPPSWWAACARTAGSASPGCPGRLRTVRERDRGMPE